MFCQVLRTVVATVYAVLTHTEETVRYYSVSHEIAAHLLLTTVTVQLLMFARKYHAQW